MLFLSKVLRPQPRPFSTIIALIVIIIGISFSASGFAAADKQATEAQLNALKKSIQNLQNSIKSNRQKQTKAESELTTSEQEIGKIGKQIAQLDEQLNNLKTDLSGYEEQKAQLESALAASRERLVKLLRQQYRLGEQPRLFMLLNQHDPEQLSRINHYYEHYNAAQVAELKKYETLLNNIRSNHIAIDSTQQAMLDNRASLQKQLDAVQASRDKRKQAVATIAKEIGSSEAKLKRLQADQAQLAKVLAEIEKSVAIAKLTRNDKAFQKLEGKLGWPVSGKIISGFGSSKDNLSADGILFAGNVGEPVAAVHHGRVVFSDWLRGYGLLIIIDHGDGYMSLYGHNDSLLKETGDWVSQGEKISTVGNSGGYNSPGLYFAIRYKGKATNPSSWLARRK